jgi:hypothetical protein
MATDPGFPCFEVQFDKAGAIFSPNDAAGQAAEFVTRNGLTDLFVFSHGWNNDMADARALYTKFFRQVRAEFDAGRVPGLTGRVFGILAVLWPSKKFAEADLIPSGAAGVASVVGDAAVAQHLEELKGVFDAPGADAALDAAKALVPKLETSPAAQEQFVTLIRSALPPSAGDTEDGSDRFFVLPGKEVLKRLERPVLPSGPRPGSGGGAAGLGHGPGGGAASFVGDLFSGMKAGAERLLNFATYYQMKERAGEVGRVGLNPLLQAIRARHPGLKLHLIGHSFGGRLVTAAALGADGQPPVTPQTMTLLQAAFSHNGFASRFDGAHDGFFRRVVADRRVAGPILITHSIRDRAVGLAYPLASRIAGQTAAGLGDAGDPFGGIGRNGAQKTPEADFGTLLAPGGPYAFAPGKLYNLKADAFIAEHSDICGEAVVFALMSSVATT